MWSTPLHTMTRLIYLCVPALFPAAILTNVSSFHVLLHFIEVQQKIWATFANFKTTTGNNGVSMFKAFYVTTMKLV